MIASACRKLNPLIYGTGGIMVERWKFVFYPFQVFATPYLQFESNPPPYSEKYFVVQSDAGTMKYRGHKNWMNRKLSTISFPGRAHGVVSVCWWDRRTSASRARTTAISTFR